MKNKGFTLVEMMTVVIILGILTMIAMAGVTKYIAVAKKKDFDVLEKNMKEATKNYLIDNPDKIPAIGAVFRITALELRNDDYLDKFLDPYNSNTDCKISDSFAEVRNNTTSTEDKIFNNKLDYKICVYCSKRKSDGC